MSMRSRRRQDGAILIVAVVMLVLMGALGLAALETVTRDQQVAGFQKRATSAFYAAEAAAAQARNAIRTVDDRSDTPAMPTPGTPGTLGDATTYPHGQPTFYGDPDFADPIRYVRDGGIYANGGNLQLKGQKFVKTLWQINVEGRAPNGSGRRLEVMETKILSAGY